METIHTCNLCGKSKPYTKDFFTVKSSNRSGLSSNCKECENLRDRNRRKKIKKFHGDNKRSRPINPGTNKPYKKGEMIGDKYVFGIRTGNYESAYPLILYSYDDFIDQYCRATANLKKRQYKRYGKWEVDITREYLLELLPKDMKCPIYDIEMTFVGHQENSIQLDRIDCTKGYIKGNVAWISAKANRNKNDANSDELYRIADWLKKQGC